MEDVRDNLGDSLFRVKPALDSVIQSLHNEKNNVDELQIVLEKVIGEYLKTEEDILVHTSVISRPQSTASKDIIPLSSGNSAPSFITDKATEDDKNELKKQLEEAVDGYQNLLQAIATTPFNSTDEAMQFVLEHDAEIEAAAMANGIDKALLQAVIFQEIRFYNMGDPLADSLVIQSRVYDELLQKYVERTNNGEFAVPPDPVVGYRHDSSTGCGQIFAATGIDAYNHYLESHPEGMEPFGSTPLDRNNTNDIDKMWDYLQDDSNNIDMAAKVLKMKADENGYDTSNLSDAEVQDTLRAYNGSRKSEAAQKYGEVTKYYYDAFENYNN